MGLPKVAIIGRPNVGKSSLFNALAGARISIVEPTAGVTRDRISTIIERKGKYFELIDTGGYGIADIDQLSSQITQQITKAIQSANLVIFMVDIRDGLTPLDEQIARFLHKQNAQVIGVANKADTAKMFVAANEFSMLGFGQFLCVSAKNNLNKAVLLDRIADSLTSLQPAAPTKPAMKLAVIGKRNAGKSTLVNAMVGDSRVIVSESPGTTRDAIDVQFEKDGQTIVVIDTAGIRKKSKIADSIEFYSFVRATRSIRRADVVLFMIDATCPISQVDKKIAKFIADEYKSCILVVNKWDLAKDKAVTSDYEQYLTSTLVGLKYAPICFTVATKAKNVDGLLKLARQIFAQTTTWIPTAKLNKAFELIKAEKVSTTKRSLPKIYYATQVAINPITILMFVNKPELFTTNYQRFIVNRLHQLLPIEEVPIKLLIRESTGKR